MKEYDQQELIRKVNSKVFRISKIYNSINNLKSNRNKLRLLFQAMKKVQVIVSHNKFNWNEFYILLQDEIQYCSDEIVRNYEIFYKRKRNKQEATENMKIYLLIKLILENILSKYTD